MCISHGLFTFAIVSLIDCFAVNPQVGEQDLEAFWRTVDHTYPVAAEPATESRITFVFRCFGNAFTAESLQLV